jgi:hypothetical protein
MVCTEVPNQIKFVSRPHPTGSRTDLIYTDFEFKGRGIKNVQMYFSFFISGEFPAIVIRYQMYFVKNSYKM